MTRCLSGMAWLLRACACSTRLAVEPSLSSRAMSLDGPWLLATDPQNVGRENQWFAAPLPEAKPTQVPWIIQEAFPGYHGVAWYWRDFSLPPTRTPHGRYLLRFWAVDYLAEVWLNGRAGRRARRRRDAVRARRDRGHQAGQTESPRRARAQSDQRADRRHRAEPDRPPLQGHSLLRWRGLQPRRDHRLGRAADGARRVRWRTWPSDPIRRPACSASRRTCTTRRSTTVARAIVALRRAGRQRRDLAVSSHRHDTFPPGHYGRRGQLQLDNPQLWDLADPYLYRVTARVETDQADVVRRAVRRVRLPRFPLRRRLFPPQRPPDLPAWLAHVQPLPDRPAVPARPRPAAPRPAEHEGDGLQHDPLHLGRRVRAATRPVRRDRPAGLRGVVRLWCHRRLAQDGRAVRQQRR